MAVRLVEPDGPGKGVREEEGKKKNTFWTFFLFVLDYILSSV